MKYRFLFYRYETLIGIIVGSFWEKPYYIKVWVSYDKGQSLTFQPL